MTYKKLCSEMYVKFDGFIHDNQAALHLYNAGYDVPKCEICNKQVTITKKFRDYIPTDSIRCKSHGHTKIISKHELDSANIYGYDIIEIPEIITTASKIKVRCKHGDTVRTAGYFLKGFKCQKCYSENRSIRISNTDWISNSSIIHNNFYCYDDSNFKSVSDIVTIICPIHGPFKQNAAVHMRGHGCPQCGHAKTVSSSKYSNEDFVSKALIVHNNQYNYDDISYQGAREKVKIKCPTHGDFDQVAYYHLSGNGCPQCGIEQTTYKSAAEYEIIQFLKDNGIHNVVQSWRGFGKELDIWIPDKNLAIEYNGVYWHSSKDRKTDSEKESQHLFKTTMCEDNNINLLHIFDIEWNSLQGKKIWKSVILNKLGLCKTKIYARKCQIATISGSDAKSFFNNNHLQGAVSGAFLNIGLIYDDELVAVGSFAKARFNKNKSYELLRFASVCDTTVTGGFSRIINEFSRNHKGSLLSYANRRWSQGGVYNQTGFKLLSMSDPCYYYTNFKTVWHRTSFQKHKLSKKLQNFDNSLSAVDNMYNNGYARIWDCGTYVFEKDL
jgi:Zn finger protein HypA/HybF involved in hydrogenase expression